MSWCREVVLCVRSILRAKGVVFYDFRGLWMVSQKIKQYSAVIT
jgi:hypothetical protein